MLNNADFNKAVIKDSPAKKKEGAVYSTKKGKTDFHPIGSLEVKDNVTLVQLLEEIVSHNQELLTKVKTLKDVILNQEERIQILEKVVANYVGTNN